MRILLINENNSKEIKENLQKTFSDKNIEFTKPLTEGFLKFEDMVDYKNIVKHIHETDFTHILISGITVLCGIAITCGILKNKKLSLLVYDMSNKKHKEVNISLNDLKG